MASFAFQKSCFGPNPAATRGEAYKLNCSPDGSRLIYGSGTTVVIRDVANPAACDVYTEHKGAVTVARFSPDGKLVASGDARGMLRVWDCEHPDKPLKKELMAIGGEITDLAWDADGKRIVVGGKTKGDSARVFMWESGSPQGELTAPKNILGVDIRPTKPSRLITACEDFKTRFYKGPPFKFTLSHNDHGNFVQMAKYSPDGALFCTVSNDSRVFLYDGESGEKVGELPKEHKGSIYSCSWHDDSTRLLTASGDKTVKVWDVKAKKCIATLNIAAKPQVGDMQCACVFAGDQIVSLSVDGTLNFLDVAKPAAPPPLVVVANTSTPTVIRFDAANGTGQLFSAARGGEVVAYSAKDGAGRRVQGEQHGSQIVDMCVAKGVVYTVGWDDHLRCFDPAKLQFAKAKLHLGAQPTGVAASGKHPDLVAVSTTKGVVLVRDMKIVGQIELESKYAPLCVSISHGGTEVIVGGSDKAAHIFKVSKDKITDADAAYAGLQAAATVVRHSPDGKTVAVGDKLKEITLWDRASAKPLIRNKWVFHTATITDLAFSPKGNFLASTSVDSGVIVWNVAKPLSKTQLKLAHYNGSQSVTWLDDDTICSSGGDYCVRQWTPKLPA